MDRLGGIFGSRDRGYDPAAHDDDDDGIDDFDADFAEDGDSDFEAAPPSPVGQDERRMQVRAYNHWAGQLGERQLPTIGELDPEAISDFGPYSVLLDFTAGVDDPALRFLGEKLATECSVDNELDHLSDVPSRSLLSRITDHYMQILANQAPIGFEAEFVNQRGNVALYRGILLPYSSDPDPDSDGPEAGEPSIDYIYGVINWKELADQATADELLLEIGQALERDSATATAEELIPAPVDGMQALIELDAAMAREEAGRFGDDGNGESDAMDSESGSGLPVPAFGSALGTASGPRIKRQALPIPDYAADETELRAFAQQSENENATETANGDDHWAIGETAGDYGLADDWDEPDCEDVDDVVDPLADQSVGAGLSSLVSRGLGRGAHLNGDAIMPAGPTGFELADAMPDDTGPRIPTAYEPEPEPEPVPVPELMPELVPDQQASDQPNDTPDLAEIRPGEPARSGETDGLYDCLAEARELALLASSTEDRSRSALYRAVGRAYDVSIEAGADPEGFAELVADSGLSVQDRAPMTPVVKLVFGAEYDKTRLTEYAAVLAHAHRLKVARGALADYLGRARGGLKGVVREERRLRREADGKPAAEAAVATVREALAKKLRALEPVALADLSDEGPEFALVMVRRTAGGALTILGEVPEDVPLLERAARRLV